MHTHTHGALEGLEDMLVYKTDPHIKLSGANSIVGRSVVIHAAGMEQDNHNPCNILPYYS